MKGIESELREALRRKQPPAGFERRVMERAEAASRARRVRRWRQGIAAGIAACVLLGAGGRYWQRRREAERTKEQLMLALQITEQQLNLVERAAVEELKQADLKEQER